MERELGWAGDNEYLGTLQRQSGLRQPKGRPKKPKGANPETTKAWEERLTQEGLPAELPPATQEIIDAAEDAYAAARAYAQDRAYSSDSGSGFDSTGEHARFATVLAQRFDLSFDDALAITQDAFDQSDRLRQG